MNRRIGVITAIGLAGLLAVGAYWQFLGIVESPSQGLAANSGKAVPGRLVSAGDSPATAMNGDTGTGKGEAPRAPPLQVSTDTRDPSRLLQLPFAQDLIGSIESSNLDSSLLELRDATILACIKATTPDNQGRDVNPAHNGALGKFVEYCRGVDHGSAQYANAEYGRDIQASAANDVRTEHGRINATIEKILDGDRSEGAVDEWLDALVNIRSPDGAWVLAQLAVDPSGPLHGLVDVGQQHWSGERTLNISYAVGDIFACANGPWCMPDRAYSMLACLDYVNCQPGASRLDIRRDSISPLDWRIAQSVAEQLRARHRQRGPVKP